MTKLSTNMQRRLKDLGMTQRELADLAGLSQVMIHKLLSGKTRETRKIVEIAKALNCDPDWLQNGEQDDFTPGNVHDFKRAGKKDLSMLDHLPLTRASNVEPLRPKEKGKATGTKAGTRKETPRATSAGEEHIAQMLEDTTPVVEIDVKAGMGGGGLAGETAVTDENGNSLIADDVRGSWGIPSAFLRAELHVSPAQVRIIEVQGDSMEPTLRSGDRVMVDLSDKRPTPPGVFAIWDGFGLVVKRLEFIPNTEPATFRIKSDNPLHDSYERAIDEINIVGRVVWYGRRL
ncbi:XRE family transcriptional regulator [Kiloniella sp. b19]|uniref:XRE family transcriptional regulator n=1 Tax=Kiloniella sp. GXU_MW_B19 TaxID=3141326 RepID=UPI0031DFC99A